MWWLALWIAVTAVGTAGVVASANSVRFARRVDREVREMFGRQTAVALAEAGSSTRAPTVDRERPTALPAPVGRYLQKALGPRARAVRTVRFRHGGTFRTSLDGAWLPIRGEQYFRSDPPGFIWWGRVRVMPGVWIDARDRSVGGIGNMFVSAESTVTLANSVGPELDQGAMLRLLGEMTWFPTAFLDDRHVNWSPIDDRHARATLEVAGREVSGIFEFDEDDLPALFSADRYRDVGHGKAVLTPFRGQSGDYREVDGLLVPHRVTGSWEVDGQRLPYVRFEVERLEFDAVEPF